MGGMIRLKGLGHSEVELKYSNNFVFYCIYMLCFNNKLKHKKGKERNLDKLLSKLIMTIKAHICVQQEPDALLTCVFLFCPDNSPMR